MKLTTKKAKGNWCHALTLGLIFLATACTPMIEPAIVPTAASTTAPITATETISETGAMTERNTITETGDMTETGNMTEIGTLPAEMVGVIWQWQNDAAADPSRYTVEFMDDGRVAVQADCNRGSGNYTLTGQVLFIEVLALTRAACGPDSLDQPFLEQINSTDGYQLEAESLVLTLRVAPGMMTLVPASAGDAGEANPPAADVTELSATEQAVVEAAMALVAAESEADPATLTLVELQAVEWPDSSLGCPQPNTMYMQVITPGYQLTVQDDAGTTYAVHSDSEGGQLLICPESSDAPATSTTELSGVLTGTVIYLQRIALPAGSVITIELQDVSRADVAAEVIATQTITTAGENVPIPFTLTYDPAQIDPRFTYAIRAQIIVEGTMRWSNTEHYAVLTNGTPTSGIEVRVMPVQ